MLPKDVRALFSGLFYLAVELVDGVAGRCVDAAVAWFVNPE
jgi:hypothetical protein